MRLAFTVRGSNRAIFDTSKLNQKSPFTYIRQFAIIISTMKRLLNLSIFPVIILGAIFSIGFSLYQSDKTYALTCPAGQVAVIDEDGDGHYARCVTQDTEVTNGCPGSGDAPNLTIGVRGGMVWQHRCYAPAPANTAVKSCGPQELAVVIGGREQCRPSIGQGTCPAGQVSIGRYDSNDDGQGRSYVHGGCEQPSAANPPAPAIPGDATLPNGDPIDSAQPNGEQGDIAGAETEAECTEAGGTWEDGECTEDEEPTCGTMATNIGWYLCPIISAAVKFADGMWGIFESLLIIEPLRVDSPVHNVWQVFRSTANVILTIVFLIVIFSQVSNVGISNYGIKKMLPKILIASVAINISFFLMQIAIDLANSLTGIIGGTIRDAAGPIDPANRGFETALEDTIVMLAAVVAGAGTVAIATAVAGPVAVLLFIALLLVPVLFGVLAGTLTLLLRELLIPILAIFAPLAFVFYLLPNTEKISKKWSSIFIGLLSFSVVAAIMYEGAMLVLMIIVAGEENPILRIAALSSIFFLMVLLPFLAFKINPLTARAFNAMRSGLNKVASPGMGVAKKARDSRAARGFAQFKNREYTPGTTRRAKAANFFSGRTAMRGVQSVVNKYDKSSRDISLDTELERKASEQAYRESILHDSTRAAELKKTPAGKAYVESIESEAIKNREFEYKNLTGREQKAALDRAVANNDHIGVAAWMNYQNTQGDAGWDSISSFMASGALDGDRKQSLRKSLREHVAERTPEMQGKDHRLKEWANSEQDINWGAATGKANQKIATRGLSADQAAGLSRNALLDIMDTTNPDSANARTRLRDDGVLQALADPKTFAGQKVKPEPAQAIRDFLGSNPAPGAASAGAGSTGLTPAPASAPGSGSSSPRGSNPPGGGNFTQQTPSGLIVPKSFGSAPASPPAGGTPVVNNITNNNTTQTTSSPAPSTPAAPPTPQPQPVQVNVQPAPAPAPTSPQPPQFTVPQSNAPQAPRSPQSPSPQPPKPNDGPRPPFGR